MRLLTEEELNFVAGGTGSSDEIPGATVTAPWSWSQYEAFFALLAGTPGGSGGGGGSTPTEEERMQENPFDDPDCDKGNAIGLLSPSDNAKYFVPENVSRDYLMGALNHLSTYAQNHSAISLLEEFKDMYTNPSNPWFIDFKDWGTSRGPAGSVGGGTTSYYSPAAGQDVTSSVFEPFGNWFYGFAGTWAGISQEALYAAAAYLQEGDNPFPWRDAPEDQPHVAAGIAAAQAWHANPHTVFQVLEGSCAVGFTTQSLGESGLQDSDILGTGATDANAGFWGTLEDMYDTAYQ